MIDYDKLKAMRDEAEKKANYYWREYQGGGSARCIKEFQKWDDMVSVYDKALEGEKAVDRMRKMREANINEYCHELFQKEQESFTRLEVRKIIDDISKM